MSEDGFIPPIVTFRLPNAGIWMPVAPICALLIEGIYAVECHLSIN